MNILIIIVIVIVIVVVIVTITVIVTVTVTVTVIVIVNVTVIVTVTVTVIVFATVSVIVIIIPLPLTLSFLFSFLTEDVTPPVLTFVKAPPRAGGDVQITWTANENVTAQCTVQTPSQINGQSCNMSWTGTNLTEGFYSIYVQLTDLAGNSAPPARHSWFVGMSILYLI